MIDRAIAHVDGSRGSPTVRQTYNVVLQTSLQVVCVTTPETDGGRVRALDRGSSRSPAVWWCLEGLLGASIAGGIVLFSYSVLADLTSVLGLLSSTAIAFLVILAWVSVWSVIAATRDHVRGRPETSRDR